MFDRAVLHLDLDAFFASVEQLRHPELRGKPVLIGGKSSRAVVASCSYEARRFGIHSAMPMRTALQRCPDAIVLRGDMETYSKYSRIVTEIIEEEAPLFEKASIDEFYVDLTGMDRFVGCWKWAVELRRRIMKETGLPLSQALAVNKLVSKVGAGEAKPNGERLIEAGTERQFLAPLSVRKLPGVGRVTYERLCLMGVRQVGTLAQMPPQLLERRFGKHGRALWRKANGIDDSPVQSWHERKSISTERTFHQDTTDVHWLRDRLTDMVTKLAWELRKKQKLTANIAVKIRYSDFNTFTQQRKIPYTAHDRTLIRHAHDLFERLYQRRQLVRLIGVRFGDLVHGHYQPDLFDDTAEEVHLLERMDYIRARFGPDAIRLASTLPRGGVRREE
ncbi:MAG: DNA polymerase IV [Bacteroidetes bacterium]|nr:MAG: DNA polymerase IV [Bacteroidota bacterium]